MNSNPYQLVVTTPSPDSATNEDNAEAARLLAIRLRIALAGIRGAVVTVIKKEN